MRTKNKTLSAGEYALDAATGKLLARHSERRRMSATPRSTPRGRGAVEYGYADGRPVRLIYRAANGQPMNTSTEQSYANGNWTTFWSASLSDVSEQDLVAAVC